MMRGGTFRCTRKNSTKHDLSDTAVIEMDVLEDLGPGRTQKEKLLETVQLILNTHPSKVFSDRSNSAPANIRYKNENVYMSNKTRR